MPFKKGQSGNPGGRPREKVWRDAILKEVDRQMKLPDGGSIRKMEALAKALVEKGLQGDTVALREIGDRIEGKPAQQQPDDAQGTNENPFNVVFKWATNDPA